MTTSLFPGRRIRRVRTLSLLAMAWLLVPGWAYSSEAPPVASTNAAQTAQTWWLEIRLSDMPTGYLREQVESNAQGERLTEQASKLVLNRMGSQVELTSLARYREGGDGLLRQVRSEVGSSAEATVIEGEVVDGVLRLRTTAGDRSYDSETALEQPLLGPQGVRERSRDALKATGDRIEYSTFAGEYGTLVRAVREVTGHETLAIDGNDVPTVLVRETLDVMPVPALLWLDADGRALRLRQESPFGMVESIRTGADVRERVLGGAELPEETYSNAVARSNIRLPRPRSLEQVTVRIELEREESVMPALDGPDLQVLERGDRHAVVRIRRGREPLPASERTATDSGVDEAVWLQPNPWLQSDHPEVVKLAHSLRQPGIDRYAQSRALQDWVAGNMAFDAGIALVTASEAVRDRRGTCLAYAVVLTSLARALEIPSRVVMGYIYAANMWGGHAWTEVLIDGSWVALDAAVWRAGPADAGRIGVIHTALEQGSASGLAELAQMYGNERIRVLGYRLDGRDVTVPDNAASFTVDGDGYRNDWLGIGFRAPAGFAFAETDIMYPRSDIVVLRRADGATISLAQRSLHPDEAGSLAKVLRGRGFDNQATAMTVSGRQALLASNDEATLAIWRDDSDLWSLRGEGRDVETAMRELLAGMTLPASIP